MWRDVWGCHHSVVLRPHHHAPTWQSASVAVQPTVTYRSCKHSQILQRRRMSGGCLFIRWDQVFFRLRVSTPQQSVQKQCLTVAVIRGDSVCLVQRLVNLVLVTRYILYYLWDKKSIFTVLCIYSTPAHKQSVVKDKTANAAYHFC